MSFSWRDLVGPTPAEQQVAARELGAGIAAKVQAGWRLEYSLSERDGVIQIEIRLTEPPDREAMRRELARIGRTY